MNELYSLKWKNHQNNLVDVFEDLWEKEAFIDLTLACAGGKTYSAHRVVLSACSLYFRELLMDPVLRETKHPVVFLRDVRGEELESLLRFMYRGHIDVIHEELAPLLKLAHSLQIKGLASVSSDEQTLLNASERAPNKRPSSDDNSNWSAQQRNKKRKSDSPVSSTSKCERIPKGENQTTDETDAREDDLKIIEEAKEEDGDDSERPVILGEKEVIGDKKVQSSFSVSNGEADVKEMPELKSTNVCSLDSAPGHDDGSGLDGDESRGGSVEFDYDDMPPNMGQWLKTEVVDVDDDIDDDLDDDIDDIDDDATSGEEGTLPEGPLDMAQADLVSSGGGDAPGDVMMPLLVRPDLIGNCVRQLFGMRGPDGASSGVLGLASQNQLGSMGSSAPPTTSSSPLSLTTSSSSSSTIAAIPVGSDGQSIQCSMCLKVIQRVSFARHKRMHKMAEGSIASVHECDVCNRKFYRKDNYVKHLDSSAHFKAMRQKRSLLEMTQQQRLQQHLRASLPVFPRSPPSPPIAFPSPFQPPVFAGSKPPGSPQVKVEDRVEHLPSSP